VRENVLPAGSAKDLEAMIPEFVADLCPKIYINLRNLKRWGSKPVRENVLPAGSAKDLEAMIPEFVADLCPKIYPEEEGAKAGSSEES